MSPSSPVAHFTAPGCSYCYLRVANEPQRDCKKGRIGQTVHDNFKMPCTFSLLLACPFRRGFPVRYHVSLTALLLSTN